MMNARWLILCISLFTISAAQGQIVFNKTEHDFGSIAQKEGFFEEDFLFRNTGDQTVHILSVRSVQNDLSFIYTRSEVLPGEYGFVKVKVHTDSLEGLFHDEVYINLRYGSEVKSDVLYVRATVEQGGRREDNRAFEDGALSTSVEVSPEDIETMEGFMGGDKLSQAQSEIDYLKRQVELKSDLIAKLSEDLFQKQASEKENMQRLGDLEKSIRQGGGDNAEALTQLDELTARLEDMQASDNRLREEIHDQEKEYARLQHEADSARSHAEDLSQRLQEQFDKQAKAMERAEQLESDLQAKERTEAQQKAKIDSLNRVLASAKTGGASSTEIKKLEEELELRRRDQDLQAAHARRQQEKILLLRKENDRFKQSTDSLRLLAENSSSENESLQQRLLRSNNRISNYESRIDSLQQLTSEISNSEQSSMAELERLRNELSEVEVQDAALKDSIERKESELIALQEERDVARKNMEALERATTRQQQQTHELMYRLNDLSSKESQAQIEIHNLKTDLQASQAREDSTRQSVNRLVNKIGDKDASIKSLSEQIEAKESELELVRNQKQATNQKLDRAQREIDASSATIDSLQLALESKRNSTSRLENDIAYLQKQVLASHDKEVEYKSRADELESRLKNAHLSNDLTFQELKGDVDAMRDERDEYKDLYKQMQRENAQLKEELMESKRSEESAIAFANELQKNTGSSSTSAGNGINFSINVKTSNSKLDIRKTFPGESKVREYRDGERYRYAIGNESSLEEALKLKEKLKARGYSQAFVVAFRGNERISLKEAMEMAQR